MEFESKLRALLGEYGFSLKNILSILDPEAGRRTSTPIAAPVKAVRKAREVKIYKNPNSGEVIETKGGNHRHHAEHRLAAHHGGAGHALGCLHGIGVCD